MGLVPAKSPWLRIEAVLLIVLGIAALIMPLFAGVALTLTLGLVLTAAGVIGVISAFAGRHHVHLGWSLASAILALLLGLFLLIFPLAAAVVLAVLIGAYLLFDGVTIIGLAVNRRNRGDKPWGWLLAAGIADLVLAVFLITLGALGAASLIGVILGIDLIFAGAALFITHASGPRLAPSSLI
jgi:uncharacterized membrane protein HdeD (DUF308 family)